MGNIKKFEKFVNDNQNTKIDESWRQVRLWLNIPKLVMEKLLHLLTGFVPKLKFEYDKYAAKIDDDSGLSPNIIKEDPIKLTLDDIENKRMRNTLKATNILNDWNIYTFDRKYENRQPIYITKDELKKGDKYYGGRIGEHTVDSEYKSNNRKRLLRKKGVEDFSEIEPQFWIIAAVHTDNHDEMSKEREVRYKKNRDKKLEREVKKAIKDGDFSGYPYPIAFKVVKEDRVDLMKNIIDGAYDDQELNDIINSLVTDDGHIKLPNKFGRKYYNDESLMDIVKSDEMRKLIEPYFNSKLWVS